MAMINDGGGEQQIAPQQTAPTTPATRWAHQAQDAADREEAARQQANSSNVQWSVAPPAAVGRINPLAPTPNAIINNQPVDTQGLNDTHATPAKKNGPSIEQQILDTLLGPKAGATSPGTYNATQIRNQNLRDTTRQETVTWYNPDTGEVKPVDPNARAPPDNFYTYTRLNTGSWLDSRLHGVNDQHQISELNAGNGYPNTPVTKYTPSPTPHQTEDKNETVPVVTSAPLDATMDSFSLKGKTYQPAISPKGKQTTTTPSDGGAMSLEDYDALAMKALSASNAASLGSRLRGSPAGKGDGEPVPDNGLVTVQTTDYTEGTPMDVEIVDPMTRFVYGDVSEHTPSYIPMAKPAPTKNQDGSFGGLQYIHTGAFSPEQRQAVQEAFYSGRSKADLEGMYGKGGGDDAFAWSQAHAPGMGGVLGDTNIDFSKNDRGVAAYLNVVNQPLGLQSGNDIHVGGDDSLQGKNVPNILGGGALLPPGVNPYKEVAAPSRGVFLDAMDTANKYLKIAPAAAGEMPWTLDTTTIGKNTYHIPNILPTLQNGFNQLGQDISDPVVGFMDTHLPDSFIGKQPLEHAAAWVPGAVLGIPTLAAQSAEAGWMIGEGGVKGKGGDAVGDIGRTIRDAGAQQYQATIDDPLGEGTTTALDLLALGLMAKGVVGEARPGIGKGVKLARGAVDTSVDVAGRAFDAAAQTRPARVASAYGSAVDNILGVSDMVADARGDIGKVTGGATSVARDVSGRVGSGVRTGASAVDHALGITDMVQDARGDLGTVRNNAASLAHDLNGKIGAAREGIGKGVSDTADALDKAVGVSDMLGDAKGDLGAVKTNAKGLVSDAANLKNTVGKGVKSTASSLDNVIGISDMIADARTDLTNVKAGADDLYESVKPKTGSGGKALRKVDTTLGISDMVQGAKNDLGTVKARTNDMIADLTAKGGKVKTGTDNLLGVSDMILDARADLSILKFQAKSIAADMSDGYNSAFDMLEGPAKAAVKPRTVKTIQPKNVEAPDYKEPAVIELEAPAPDLSRAFNDMLSDINRKAPKSTKLNKPAAQPIVDTGVIDLPQEKSFYDVLSDINENAPKSRKLNTVKAASPVDTGILDVAEPTTSNPFYDRLSDLNSKAPKSTKLNTVAKEPFNSDVYDILDPEVAGNPFYNRMTEINNNAPRSIKLKTITAEQPIDTGIIDLPQERSLEQSFYDTLSDSNTKSAPAKVKAVKTIQPSDIEELGLDYKEPGTKDGYYDMLSKINKGTYVAPMPVDLAEPVWRMPELDQGGIKIEPMDKSGPAKVSKPAKAKAAVPTEIDLTGLSFDDIISGGGKAKLKFDEPKAPAKIKAPDREVQTKGGALIMEKPMTSVPTVADMEIPSFDINSVLKDTSALDFVAFMQSQKATQQPRQTTKDKAAADTAKDEDRALAPVLDFNFDDGVFVPVLKSKTKAKSDSAQVSSVDSIMDVINGTAYKSVTAQGTQQQTKQKANQSQKQQQQVSYLTPFDTMLDLDMASVTDEKTKRRMLLAALPDSKKIKQERDLLNGGALIHANPLATPQQMLDILGFGGSSQSTKRTYRKK